MSADDKVELAQAELRKQMVPKIVKLVNEQTTHWGGDGRHVLMFLEELVVVLVAGKYRSDGYAEVVDTLAAGCKERLDGLGRELEVRRQRREALDAATRRN